MFFDNTGDLLSIVIKGGLAYVMLIVLLRITGKRTLSKMNAFDLVVTVALGSTLATLLLSKDVALLEDMVAFILLIGMQYVITWLSVRSALVRRWVKSEPTLLFHRDQFLPQALMRERVTEAEVRAAVRAQGIAALESVEAVVLETDGSFSVMRSTAAQPATALHGVRNAPQG